MLLIFECLARTTLSNRLRDGDHCHDTIPQPIMSIMCGLLSDEEDCTTVGCILQSGCTLMTSGRSDVIASGTVSCEKTLLMMRGSVSPRVRPRVNGAWGRVLERGSTRR